MSDYQYLGDGVYVMWDGYHVVIMANSHIQPTDVIYFDPYVLKSFMKYVERLERQLQEKDEQENE